MKVTVVLLLFVCFTMLGCIPKYEMIIPDGKYFSSQTNESVEVNGSHIKFGLFSAVGKEESIERVTEFSYYYVDKRFLEIRPEIRTSHEFMEVGIYRWYWVDGKIFKFYIVDDSVGCIVFEKTVGILSE